MMDTKGKNTPENIELAFEVFRANGGNKVRTIADLGSRGLRISRLTLDRWAKQNSFYDRLVTGDSRFSFEERMMLKLVAQIEKYEKYFDAKTELDNQAVHAYTNLLKTVIELSRKLKLKEKKSTPEQLKAEAEKILEAEYGIKR
ncbi:MAG: hypothetical protein M0Z75_14070 [Nitrospiraceae bacterium]|nr:hypothetical protein [Nitrospiraceae bacterium]